MESKLTVRTCGGVWQGEVDDWTALVVLAALSAEPETLDELAMAARRYLPDHRLFEAGEHTAGIDRAAGGDGPWCLVDLVGHTVVGRGEFELPDPSAAYKADDDEQVDGFPIVWLDTPPDWLFQEADGDWRELVSTRAASRADQQRVDARAVLFGQALFEFFADRVLAASTVHANQDEDRQLELTRSIHAEWLMTPRQDLSGRTPREILLADRDRIQRDLEHRANQWSKQGHAPPGLPIESAAYRYGGFGTTEIVLYFDLVRSLLDVAWLRCGGEQDVTRDVLIGQLSDHRDRWFASLPEDGSGNMSHAELIESERRHMPIASDGNVLDHDCPLCRAEAAGLFGIGFMWFDGHQLELEDEFAFSLTASREEWESEQEDYRKFSEEMDSKRAEERTSKEDAPDESVWQTSHVDWDGLAREHASPELAKLSIGFPLAELVNDLRVHPENRTQVERLNEAYVSLRTAQDGIAEQSAAERLRDRLEDVAREHPALTSKSADLQSRIDELLRSVVQNKEDG